MEEIPDSYKEFQRLRLPILHPLDPPISLPVLPKDIDPGRFFFLLLPSILLLSKSLRFSPRVQGLRFDNCLNL